MKYRAGITLSILFIIISFISAVESRNLQEPHKDWEEVEANVIDEWEELNYGLNPLQQPVDLTPFIRSEDDYCAKDYFKLATDQEYPLFKPLDPFFGVRDNKSPDLEGIKIDVSFLNFTESYLYVTSTKTIYLANESKKYELKLTGNFTSDCQVSVVSSDDAFNKIVKEGRKHKLNINFTPNSLTPLKAQVYLSIHLVNNKKNIFSRNIILDVYSGEIQNPYRLPVFSTINLKVNQTWNKTLSIYNPNLEELKIMHTETHLEVKLPKSLVEMNEDNKYASDANSEGGFKQWKIPPSKTQKFLEVSYFAEEPGWKSFDISLDTQTQNFTIPVRFFISHETLVFNKQIYDLGVITDPQIPHEVSISVSNPSDSYIQILDIYASIEDNSYVRIFWIDSNPLLEPFVENRLIAKIRALPSKLEQSKYFSGKILVRTNDTRAGGDFIQLKYKYGYYPNLLLYDRSDTSIYLSGNKSNQIKTISAANNFTVVFEIKNFKSPNPLLDITKSKSNYKLPLHQRETLFDITFNQYKKTQFNSWILLEASGMYIPVHIKFYDKLLHCQMLFDQNQITERCSNLNKISLNFGVMALNEVRKKTLSLVNYNPLSISLISINCSLPNCFTDLIKFTVDEFLDTYETSLDKDLNLTKSTSPNKPLIKDFGSRYKLTFSVIVDKAHEEYRSGDIIIKTSEEIIKIPLKYQSLSGGLTFTPQIVRFQPGYPGKKQETPVYIRNQFNMTMTISNLISDNSDIIPILKNPVLNPSEKVEAFKIVFDPSENKNIDFLNAANTSGPYNYGITLDDLLAWKQGKKVWEELVSNSSTELKSWIRIVNDISDKTFLNVKASLTNPLLVREPISFDVIKIHSRVTKNITIENPSDLPIYIQLFLGPKEFSNLNFVSDIISQSQDSKRGEDEKELSCIVDFVLESSQLMMKAGLHDKGLFRYEINHINTDQMNATKFTKSLRSENSSKNNDPLDLYVKRSFICSDAFDSKFEDMLNNQSSRFAEKLEFELDKGDFTYFNKITAKKNPIYEMKAMSYAIPRNYKRMEKVDSIKDKILKYFDSWISMFEFESSVDREKAVLLEELKRNVKEIYVKDFNSLQSDQQVFLNPKYRDTSVYIPPHSNITIPALIYQPSSFKEYSTVLYIKNNLTSIFEIPVRGVGGFGNLLVSDVQKFDEEKGKYVRSTGEVLEGDHNTKMMKFIIDKSEFTMIDTTNCKDCPPGTKKLRLNKPFERKFTIKNDGNLPMDIIGISIQNLGCEGYGFQIENCHGFKLSSNEEYDIIIKYVPDMSLTYFTRTLLLYTDQETFEFDLQIKMPIKNLYDSVELYQFKSKVYIQILSYIIIIGIFIIMFKLAREYFARHGNPLKKQWKLSGQEMLNFKHPNEIFENIISVKHTFTPMIPPTKINASKRQVSKGERSNIAAKPSIKTSDFEEELKSKLNKFEDSEPEIAPENKKAVSHTMQKPEAKSEKAPIKNRSEVIQVEKEPEAAEKEIVENKNVEVKKEFNEKPKKYEPTAPKLQERKIINSKQNAHEYHRENKKYQDKDIIYYQPKSKKIDSAQQQSNDNSNDISKISNENNSETFVTNRKESEKIEEHKKDTESHIIKQNVEEQLENKLGKKNSGPLSFDSDDELLNEGFKVSEAIISKEDVSNDVGAIGSKSNEKTFLKNNPRYVEKEKSTNISEPTSEDETHFYGYFGGYKPPVFNQATEQAKPNQPSDRWYNSQFFRNDDLLANTPGLGLFQTRREGSRYSQNLYFPSMAERGSDTPPKKPPVITNNNPFFTGSEDESGVISESSVSSKQIYSQERDDSFSQNRKFNFPNENRFQLAQLFFPGLNNNANSGNQQEIYDQDDTISPTQNQISDTGLNMFFGPGIRHRNPSNSNSGNTNLPPGLH